MKSEMAYIITRTINSNKKEFIVISKIYDLKKYFENIHDNWGLSCQADWNNTEEIIAYQINGKLICRIIIGKIATNYYFNFVYYSQNMPLSITLSEIL